MAPLKQYVSDKEIEVALHSVAQLVNVYGEKYWPIFDRLEEELDKRRSKSKRLAEALLNMDMEGHSNSDEQNF